MLVEPNVVLVVGRDPGQQLRRDGIGAVADIGVWRRWEIEPGQGGNPVHHAREILGHPDTVVALQNRDGVVELRRTDIERSGDGGFPELRERQPKTIAPVGVEAVAIERSRGGLVASPGVGEELRLVVREPAPPPVICVDGGEVVGCVLRETEQEGWWTLTSPNRRTSAASSPSRR